LRNKFLKESEVSSRKRKMLLTLNLNKEINFERKKFRKSKLGKLQSRMIKMMPNIRLKNFIISAKKRMITGNKEKSKTRKTPPQNCKSSKRR
jgi:hypothetical protein